MAILQYPALGAPVSTRVTTYASNKILDHVCDVAQVTAPTTLYMGLLLDDGGLSGGGQPTHECTHADYYRAVATFNTTTKIITAVWQMNDIPNREATNVPWGDFPFCAIYDAATGGNCWFWAHYHKVITGTTAQVLRVDRAFYTLTLNMKLAL